LTAVLIDAEGPHFSYGASVAEHLPEHCAAMLGRLHRMLGRIIESPVPVLVAVRGKCLGGGLELAWRDTFSSLDRMPNSASRRSISASLRPPPPVSCPSSSVFLGCGFADVGTQHRRGRGSSLGLVQAMSAEPTEARSLTSPTAAAEERRRTALRGACGEIRFLRPACA